MDFEDVVRTRHSTRTFSRERVSEAEIRALVDLSSRGPSSLNGRPWHFLLVSAEDTKRSLAEIKNRHCPPEKRDYPADFIRDAAWIVLVCVDRSRSHGRDIENAVIATTILLLAAHARGLGGVFMTAQSAEQPALAREISRLLGIPDGVVPVTLVPLGRPAGTVGAASRPDTPFEGNIHVERF